MLCGIDLCILGVGSVSPWTDLRTFFERTVVVAEPLGSNCLYSLREGVEAHGSRPAFEDISFQLSQHMLGT
jgi:hypothetical protein